MGVESWGADYFDMVTLTSKVFSKKKNRRFQVRWQIRSQLHVIQEMRRQDNSTDYYSKEKQRKHIENSRKDRAGKNSRGRKSRATQQ